MHSLQRETNRGGVSLSHSPIIINCRPDTYNPAPSIPISFSGRTEHNPKPWGMDYTNHTRIKTSAVAPIIIYLISWLGISGPHPTIIIKAFIPEALLWFHQPPYIIIQAREMNK